MIYNFVSTGALSIEVEGIQLTKSNIDDVIKFAGNVRYYIVKDNVSGTLYLHLKLDLEGWFRISEFDFVIKYKETNKIYAYSPNVFFQYYKKIN